MEILMQLGTTIIKSLLLLVIFLSIKDKKTFITANKIRTVLFCITIISADLLSSLYCTKFYYNVIMLIMYVLVFACIMKLSIKSSLTISLGYMILCFAVQRVVKCMDIFVISIGCHKAISYTLKFDVQVYEKVIYIILLIIIYRYRKNLRSLKILNEEKNTKTNIIMIGILFILFIVKTIFEIVNQNNLLIVHLLVLLACIVLLVVVLNDIRERREMAIVEANYKVQKQQIKNMEEIIGIVRKEKHDFANHIQVIQALCSMNRPGDIEKIKEYVGKISGSLHKSFRYLDTGNDYVDALISVKYYYAQENHIDLRLSIDEPFSSMHMEEDELISIIGNLVDNAFQAFEQENDNKDKIIEISSLKKQDKIYINISNNGDMIPKEVKNKIFNKGFSTKKKESADHGYGLYITKQLVEKNNGNIRVESSEDKTEFIIEFSVDSSL